MSGARRAMESLVALLGEPVRVEDEAGALVYGDASASGARHPIVSGGATVGAVVGPDGAAALAGLLAHLYERELEKLALADETLGRYKELTLLYEIGDKLARVLDVEEIERLVVDEAKRFLKAASATVLVADLRRGLLEPVASSDAAARTHVLDAAGGVEARVLASGRAEFVEDVDASGGTDLEPGVASLICAPLRNGETVFGILRVTSAERGAWNAGHLKLVTSLAGNAGAAISHARLHGERMREQALRHEVSRFASPLVLDAAFDGAAAVDGASVATLFCDLGELARFAAADHDASVLLGLVDRAKAFVIHALLAEGGVVQVSGNEMLVGLFGGVDFDAAARAAVRAARSLVRALDRRFGGLASRSPGVALTHATLSCGRAAEAFFDAVGTAAELQRRAEGRIVVDERIGASLGEALKLAVGLTDARGRGMLAYEVSA